MAYRYLILEIAQEEYESAIAWYLDRSYSAAEKFVEAIENTLMLICEHPDRWRNEYGRFYELGVKKYPYSILYTIEQDDQLILVSSIYHHKRNPEERYKR